MMSAGISEALVTTVLGLLTAIPLLLIHSFLSSRSNAVIQVLDQQSTAYIAALAEDEHKRNA
jgi:biopolymer transport protein ExbB